MKKAGKKIIIALGAAAVIILIFVLLTRRPVESFREKYAGTDFSVEIEGMEREDTYAGYLKEHEDAEPAAEEVEVALFDYESEGEVSEEKDYYGEEKVLLTDTGSRVTWNVEVPAEGFYQLYMEYLIPESRGVAAERSVEIGGELPFEDARNITFDRIWTNGGEVRRDNRGNEIRPSQVESFAWQSGRFRDDRGYIEEPYSFYFAEGENELTLEAVNEPMAIRKLVLAPAEEEITYAEYLAGQEGKASGSAASDFSLVIQGEDSTYRSESSLYAKYDRSSPTTVPNSVTSTVLNYIGGDPWRSNGQWIEWSFTVPEDGFYHIMIKGRQNYSRGSVSNRSVYIDGEIPFAEMKEISFPYSNDWNSLELSDREGNVCSFYLTEGEHTIRVQATLGGMGSILKDLEDSTFRLNQIYRRLLVYTGANPDQYRDYHIDTTYPEIMQAMDLEAKRLYKIVDDMVDYSGQKADQIATAQTVAQQLERFCAKPQNITTEFTTFKDNITSLGTASLNMSETKLDIDYLVVYGENVKPKKDTANFFSSTWHEMKSFAASFFVDYNSVGDVYEAGSDEKIVKVWVLSGRDQGTILKTMIDDDFTPSTGIPVNVEIVAPEALLNAVMAGRGPNIALTVGADQPVNYALRHASEDLTQFDGWEEVFSHYSESSYEQYKLEGGIYGIPETQTFNVMFYREDVMEELVSVYEETGDDAKAEKYRSKIKLVEHNMELDKEEKARETAEDGLQ